MISKHCTEESKILHHSWRPILKQSWSMTHGGHDKLLRVKLLRFLFLEDHMLLFRTFSSIPNPAQNAECRARQHTAVGRHARPNSSRAQSRAAWTLHRGRYRRSLVTNPEFRTILGAGTSTPCGPIWYITYANILPRVPFSVSHSLISEFSLSSTLLCHRFRPSGSNILRLFY